MTSDSRAFLFWITWLYLGLLLLFYGCATPEPQGQMAQTCELAAYVTAKRELALYPSGERRSEFQSTVDIIDVLLSEWTPRPISEKQLAQALAWLDISELRCATGAVIIGKETVRYEGLDGKPRKIEDEDLVVVAFEVSQGLKRFLEINNDSR